MSKVLFKIVVLINIIPLDARLYHNPKYCLAYNFEKSENTLEYKVKRLDFLLENYIGRIQEWETQYYCEDIGKPSFNIGRVGIKPQISYHPHTLSYGVSRSKIHVVNGGVLQFNLYKQSKKSLPIGNIAYISVLLLDRLSRAKENLTLFIMDQQEGWSQPVLRLNKSQEMFSYIHLFGHYSESVFFYVDAIRFYTYDVTETNCTFYDSSESESPFLQVMPTTDIKQSNMITKQSTAVVPTFEVLKQLPRNMHYNMRKKNSIHNESALVNIVKENNLVEKQDSLASSPAGINKDEYYSFPKTNLNKTYKNNRIDNLKALELDLLEKINEPMNEITKKGEINNLKRIRRTPTKLNSFLNVNIMEKKIATQSYLVFNITMPNMNKVFGADWVVSKKHEVTEYNFEVSNNNEIEKENSIINDNNENSQNNNDNVGSNAVDIKNENEKIFKFSNKVIVLKKNIGYKNEMSKSIILVAILVVQMKLIFV